MRVLITGVTGFVGSHLAEYLLARGDAVYGTARWRSQTENITQIQDKINLVECDLRDVASVKRVLAECRPEAIFHLAAQSFVHSSWIAPEETLTTNILGQLHIFEALRDLDMNPPMTIAGSSEEYGMVKEDEVPIKESNPLRPLSPYAVSKVGQDLLAYQYHQSYGTHVIRTRAFNHDGPRRGKVFATSNFAFQVAQIEKGLVEPILRVGNLDALRDFTDVRDIVKGYVLAVEKAEPGEVYNLCSGKAYSIKQMLDMLLDMSNVDITVEQDPARMRPSDVPILLGDYSKFHAATGWKPTIPFEKTMEDLLNYWRERV